MGGVVDLWLSRELPNGMQLQLYIDWSNEEDFVTQGPLEGALPGPGVTELGIAIAVNKDADPQPLQSFRYKGGGHLKSSDTTQIPPKVASAFEKWFAWFSSKADSSEMGDDAYHSDAAARGENPYYPGLPTVPEGGYRCPNPTGVWKTEARSWLMTHPNESPRITSEEVERLYRAGALLVELWFYNGGGTGCAVTPPYGIAYRRALIQAIRLTNPEWWVPEIDFDWDRETAGNSDQLQREYEEARRVATERFDEELAQDVSSGGPWDIF